MKRIRSLRDKNLGSRAFILANGPSVTAFDLGKCKSDVVIGMNASSLLQESNNFVMDYYCVSDRRFLTHPEKKKYAFDFVGENTTCVFRADLSDLVLRDNTYFTKALARDGFSFSLDHGFYYGCSTTILAIQLAYYIGCKEIYLLGVDLQYKKEAPRFYKESTPQIEDSFMSVQIHNLLIAKKALATKGRSIFTCSEDSLVRPYLEYREFNLLF
ncbi:MAG: DUF115 domain-containing protein [Oceanospirillaceae bacterium]|nr:DUF115 domain-containing protein [Oceanospirillaceae bacterium]